MYTDDIKAQTRPFVNRFGAKMYTNIQPEIPFHFVKQRGLTFDICRAKVCSSKRISQTAATKTVRQSELPESQRLVQADSPTPSDPSLPSRCAEQKLPGASVFPTLQG